MARASSAYDFQINLLHVNTAQGQRSVQPHLSVMCCFISERLRKEPQQRGGVMEWTCDQVKWKNLKDVYLKAHGCSCDAHGEWARQLFPCVRVDAAIAQEFVVI